MFSKIFSKTVTLSLFVSLTSAQTCGHLDVFTPSDDTLIFAQFPLQLAHPLALFDGPASISAAPTETVRTVSMTTEQIKYYNYFSAAVYCPTSLKTLSCCYCGHFNSTVTDFEIIENELYGTKALVTLHAVRGEIVVTFRGSVGIMNWILDFTLIPTSAESGGPGIRIHRGVFLSLMTIYNKVVTQVGVYLACYPGARVVVNGHSLGGAMSSLFIYLVTSLNQFPTANYALVTFGQLRVGNVHFTDYTNALPIMMSRVVARDDIIPHLPPVSAFGVIDLLIHTNYLHHGQEVWINGSEINFCSQAVYEDPTCSNSLGPLYTIIDHLQYFDADYSVCYFVEGWLDIDLISIAGFIPTDYIPPMPTVMAGILTGLVEGGYEGILPVIG
ncbi:lipase [Folsomia candida]|uniref:Lipase n=1 Tax=Folsomia candida TaxID=158441 RepID=A0A226DID4_FOLCA|nr:lipase [Folsomia candida]OXA44939.1 Lipase [Folsomia candida]